MSPVRMSKIESGIRTVLAFNKACNRHDVAGMMKLVRDDCTFESAHPAPDGTVYTGKTAITHFWQDFFRESPKVRIKIEDIFSFHTRCISHWRYEWETANGEKAHIRGVDIYKVDKDAITEILSYVKG